MSIHSAIAGPTVNVQPRYPERQNSVLENCRPHNVKNLANKFTQLALQDEPTSRHKKCLSTNYKAAKLPQSKNEDQGCNRPSNSNATVKEVRQPIPSINKKLENKMSTMYVTKARVSESNTHTRRPAINENDPAQRKISVWSSSRSCTESYLGRSTNLAYPINSQTRNFSTLPLPKRTPNSSVGGKSNGQSFHKTSAKNRAALRSRDMNRIHAKQQNETADNFLNEKLSTSQKHIDSLREISNEPETMLENNGNTSHDLNNLVNNNNETFQRLCLNSNNDVLYERSNNTQLLHPDWRRVPWKEYFGWTDDHQRLVSRLHERVGTGEIDSIYYGSAQQHVAAEASLPGPTVTTVREMLEVMGRAVDAWRESRSGLHGWSRSRRSPARWKPPRAACYDADDEDWYYP